MRLLGQRGSDDRTLRAQEVGQLIELYRLGVQTQMHFNELILRTRVLGATGTVVVLGAAMIFRLEHPGAAFEILGYSVKAPAVVAMFSMVLLLVVWLLDRRYYLSLLGGASRYVYRIEDYAKEHGITLAGYGDAFGQGRTIQRMFGAKEGASTRYVLGAYVFVGLIEVAYALLLLFA